MGRGRPVSKSQALCLVAGIAVSIWAGFGALGARPTRLHACVFKSICMRTAYQARAAYPIYPIYVGLYGVPLHQGRYNSRPYARGLRSLDPPPGAADHEAGSPLSLFWGIRLATRTCNSRTSVMLNRYMPAPRSPTTAASEPGTPGSHTSVTHVSSLMHARVRPPMTPFLYFFTRHHMPLSCTSTC